ncbi:Short-chain dehydrogenase/reductase SDR [Macleaya cordata]|uniref:Secoisolariciresinol dehydrogenase n=1 Tax=Macleaya cordata TaxID=56857 RepID=A0A200QSV7_MACCD|nr:Short-chain dehydrogenase/reductase SDR [Macleaya cordata]
MSIKHLRLEGKVAIITGAAGGIGEEAARLFVENGAFVVIADVQDELGDQVVASIGSDKACYKHCDVRDEKQVEETVAYALEKYGTLDIVYSNAGILGSLRGILDLDMASFKNTMAINVCGGATMIKHAARAMIARKIRGSIVLTASIAATRGGLAPHAYTASKHAVLGVVRSASRELGVYGIRVNCVSPFGVATPMSCKGVVLKARDIAEAALFLASNESGCISGHDLVVDGGLTISCNVFPIDAK